MLYTITGICMFYQMVRGFNSYLKDRSIQGQKDVNNSIGSISSISSNISPLPDYESDFETDQEP